MSVLGEGNSGVGLGSRCLWRHRHDELGGPSTSCPLAHLPIPLALHSIRSLQARSTGAQMHTTPARVLAGSRTTSHPRTLIKDNFTPRTFLGCEVVLDWAHVCVIRGHRRGGCFKIAPNHPPTSHPGKLEGDLIKEGHRGTRLLAKRPPASAPPCRAARPSYSPGGPPGLPAILSNTTQPTCASALSPSCLFFF